MKPSKRRPRRPRRYGLSAEVLQHMLVTADAGAKQIQPFVDVLHVALDEYIESNGGRVDPDALILAMFTFLHGLVMATDGLSKQDAATRIIEIVERFKEVDAMLPEGTY